MLTYRFFFIVFYVGFVVWRMIKQLDENDKTTRKVAILAKNLLTEAFFPEKIHILKRLPRKWFSSG